MANFCIFTHNFHKIMLLFFYESELVPHPAQNKCCCSGPWISVVCSFPAAVAVHVSTIPCCTIAWQRRCLQLFQPWKCRLVSWHVSTYLASLSLSLSFVMKESSPTSPFHRCTFTLKSYTNFLWFSDESWSWSCNWFTGWRWRSGRLLASGLELAQE